MTVKRRSFIRVTSYLIAFCFVFAIAGFFAQKAKASYEDTLERVRFESLNSLCEYTKELSGGLRLLAVSAGDSVADSAAYVCSRAIGAIGCTSCFDGSKIENISRFLNGVYDFAKEYTASEANQTAATELSLYAEEMYYHLSDFSAAVMGGVYSLSEYGSVYQRKIQPYFEDSLDFENGKEDEIFSLTAVSSKVSAAEFLKEKESITPEEARKIASDVAQVNSALWRDGGEQIKNGTEVFSFNHGDIAVDISKSGGFLCRFINPMPCAKTVYHFEDAKKTAESFLERQGYDDMQIFGGEQSEFTAFFSFVPSVNGVLILTAQIKINVCLASGNITYFDAFDYVKNCRADVFADSGSSEPSFLLPTNLELQKTVLCLAKIDGRERLCYLAVCSFGEDNVLVYVDSLSYRILKTEIVNFSLLI